MFMRLRTLETRLSIAIRSLPSLISIKLLPARDYFKSRLPTPPLEICPSLFLSYMYFMKSIITCMHI
jgi:hypothetical protein